MYPVLLESPVKSAIWGGNTLNRLFGIEDTLAAEVWLLACSFEGESVVKNGDLKGYSLGVVAEKYGKKFFGSTYTGDAHFPLFIRAIDAAERMPLVVSNRQRVIYIQKATAASSVILGFNRNISDDELKTRIRTNTLSAICNNIPVKSGQIITVPKGTLHAIGKDIIAFEILPGDQREYTVTDYGRIDQNGKTAPLQIEKALSVIEKSAYFQNDTEPDVTLYPFGTVITADSDFAEISFMRINGSVGVSEDGRFVSVIVTDGEITVSYPSGTVFLKRGDSIVVPTDMKIKLTGTGDVICTIPK